jgi:hypothetical protein
VRKDWLYNNRFLVGGALALMLVGVIIYANSEKLKSVAKETLGGQKWFDASLKWWRNSKTKTAIEKLHPSVRDKFAKFFADVERKLGLQMIATSGTRTDEEQALLNKENPANAKAGLSDHNYGFALDINVLDKSGKVILRKASPKAEWEKSGVIAIAKQHGINWGGDFKSYADNVHFYDEANGKTTAQMLALKNSGKVDSQGYVIV